MQPAPGEIGLISTTRRLTLLGGFYVMSLFMLAAFLGGSVELAVFMIAIAEVIAFLWQPTPKLGLASYTSPLPARWRLPVQGLMWYELIGGCLGMAGVSVIATGIFAFVFVSMISSIRSSGLRPANVAVLGLVAIWLVTRPLWYPRFRKAVERSFQGVKNDLSRDAPLVSVGTDSIDVYVKVNTFGGGIQKRWVLHVTFAEIDEIRTMDALSAQAYWQTMEQYDPSLSTRAALELIRYVNGELPRPSIFQHLAGGTHVLIRSPGVLYLVGWADQSGPIAVASWQQWRATQQVPKSPTA